MHQPDTTENTAEKSVDIPKHVVDALGQLGNLTYQHRQMLKDGDVLSLLEQIVAARQSHDWMSICGTVGFGANFVFGLPVGQLNWISGIIAAACFFSYRAQKQTIEKVTKIVREFADTQGYQAPTQESQLQAELRTNYSLTYQQNQQLKAGDTIAVAARIAASHRRNGWLQFVLMSVCAAPQVVIAGIESRSLLKGIPSTTPMLSTSLQALLYLGFGIQTAITQHRRARKLENLIGLHPAEMAAMTLGAGTYSDDDSPYRSPQFR